MNAMEQGAGRQAAYLAGAGYPGSATWPPASIASSAIRRPAESPDFARNGDSTLCPAVLPTKAALGADGLARPDSVPVLPLRARRTHGFGSIRLIGKEPS